MKKRFYLICSLAALTVCVILAFLPLTLEEALALSSRAECEAFCKRQTYKIEFNDGSTEEGQCDGAVQWFEGEKCQCCLPFGKGGFRKVRRECPTILKTGRRIPF